jgi:hypothetical protein
METNLAVQTQVIENKIYEIRGQKVMLDFDLAEMYQVETKVLNQTVKRNIERFPTDFMFQLTNQELTNLRSQIVTSSWGGKRYLPYAFTEHGVTMLSSVLKSERAVKISIMIVRAFIAMKEYALNYNELAQKLRQLEQKYDTQFDTINEAINFLIQKKEEEYDQKNRRKIGF